MVNLKQRSFLARKDVTGKEIRFLIRLASDLEAAELRGYERNRLCRKNTR